MAAHALATITNPAAALTDFTLIVDLANMPADWWAAVDTSDGTRGRVYKGDGTTRLAADWIEFDDQAETGLLRVLWSGTLATSGTQQLWIEPPVSGNDSVAADDTYGSDNAYDSSWGGYWPLGRGTDRTANGNDGTATGSPGSAAGIIGVATTFNGGLQYIDVGNDASIRPTGSAALTLMGWGYPTGWGEGEATIIRGGFNGPYILGYQTSSEVRAYVYTSGWQNVAFADSNVPLNTWTHLALTYNGSTLISYDDAYARASGSVSGNLAAGDTTHALIGAYNHDGKSWVGRVQEVQVHTTVRSGDWILQEYAQTEDNAEFWGEWSWELGGGPEPTYALPHYIYGDGVIA